MTHAPRGLLGVKHCSSGDAFAPAFLADADVWQPCELKIFCPGTRHLLLDMSCVPSPTAVGKQTVAHAHAHAKFPILPMG